MRRIARSSAALMSVNGSPCPGMTTRTSSVASISSVARVAGSAGASISGGITKPKPFSHNASPEIRIRCSGL